MSSARDDVRVYRFEGDFGSQNIWQVQSEIEALLDEGVTKLVLNVGRMTFINSSALGFLIKVWKDVTPKGGTVVFSEPTDFMTRTLSVLGLDTVFKVYPDDDTALAALED
ncbi:MAG: STAS domain-containing protein [Planctomycetota bacterium]